MHILLLILGSLLVLSGSIPAAANTSDSSERTTTHTITSKVPGEQRVIMVRTPPDYDAQRKYPVSGERILLGHSFGGVLTLHALFRDPDLFEAYIALGSSAWIASSTD